MIFLDTSTLIDALTAGRRSGPRLISHIEAGEEILVSTLVLYEWLRGPRTHLQLLDQETILPSQRVVPFGPEEAARAADLYKRVPRARTRAIDLAIAATAMVRDAALWTLNSEDFRDIPGLKLV